MVFSVDSGSNFIVRRLVRPVLLLITTVLAVSVYILGTIHLFVPILTGA